MPAPATRAPARLDVELARSRRYVAVPAAARAARAAWLRADRMQFLTIRRTLAVIFAALVLFLAVVAWLEGQQRRKQGVTLLPHRRADAAPALMLAAAPLLVGLVRRLKARLLGPGRPADCSPGATCAGWRASSRCWPRMPRCCSPPAPLVSFAAIGAAALLVPSFALGMPGRRSPI